MINLFQHQKNSLIIILELPILMYIKDADGAGQAIESITNYRLIKILYY